MEVRPSNVVQIVTDNVVECKAAIFLIEVEFLSIYWTPCVVHTLNLGFKYICSPKNTKKIVMLTNNGLGSHKLQRILVILKTLSWTTL